MRSVFLASVSSSASRRMARAMAILWRLRRYEIELPPQAQALTRYASVLFARPSFRDSLSDAEIEMRAS